MRGLERFERWAERAREEPVPVPDVAEGVRARILVAGAPSAAPPVALIGLCAAAAVVLAVLGCHSWIALSDPWLGLILGFGTGWAL